jgi:hypothetical protein
LSSWRAVERIVKVDFQRRGNVKKSQDRILVTPAGSLPRGEPLGSMLIDQEAGEATDAVALKKAIDARVSRVLEKQLEVGIEEVNNGAECLAKSRDG